jgi:rhodanese-related sulfurtransferase
MQAVRATLIQALILLNVGVALGLLINAARAGGKGYINPTMLYGPKNHAAAPSAQVAARPDAPRSGGADAGDDDDQGQTISFSEVRKSIQDPARFGLDVIVDARDDGPYREGHLPRAVQFWPYQTEYYIHNVLDLALGAERVIIYCNGGECEDSHFAAEQLVTHGVLPSQIYIYAGGWEEWKANNAPVEVFEE